MGTVVIPGRARVDKRAGLDPKVEGSDRRGWGLHPLARLEVRLLVGVVENPDLVQDGVKQAVDLEPEEPVRLRDPSEAAARPASDKGLVRSATLLLKAVG